MTAKFKSFRAIALTAVITVGAVPASAFAGQLSFNFAPRGAEQRQMVQLGLGVYSLVEGIENGSIRQNGRNNSAGLTQYGRDNLGIVHQDGNNHTGTLTQNNGDNSYGLFQFGEGTNAHVNQSGGQSGLGFVFGW